MFVPPKQLLLYTRICMRVMDAHTRIILGAALANVSRARGGDAGKGAASGHRRWTREEVLFDSKKNHKKSKYYIGGRGDEGCMYMYYTDNVCMYV
jgi:hypothetical protein